MNSPPSYPSLWNLAGNPVFLRHAVARLRTLPFIAWLVITQILTGFAWSLAVFTYLSLKKTDAESFASDFASLLDQHGTNAATIGWIVVLGMQGLLLILKGTFSVATGVAREANEGMIEAEHLSPLPTGHKVIGQLLGLPVLENVLALLMIPWALLSAWLGELSLGMMMKVYVLLATSVLLHHAIGLVAGTIIRQKILAGTLSQVMVVLLHFVLPAFSGFGIGMISHLGVEAAIFHEIVVHTPEVLEVQGGFLPLEFFSDPVRFFQWEIGLPGYHWLITVSGVAALLTILARRWNDQDSQKLGKIGTTVLAVWILTLTCGELIPGFRDGQPLTPAVRAVLWTSGFGLVLGWINLLLTSGLVPSPEARTRLKRSLRPAPWWSDGRDALCWVAGISVLGAAAWALVTDALFRNTIEPPAPHFGMEEVLWMTASLVVPACAWHLLVLWRGWKQSLFIAFALGAVPLMIATLGMVITSEGNGWPIWVAGVSGLVMPGLAGVGEISEFPAWVFRVSVALLDSNHSTAMNSEPPVWVFRVSVALHVAAAIFLAWKVYGKAGVSSSCLDTRLKAENSDRNY